MSPTYYYWDKDKVLLLNHETASNCEDLVAGLCAFFGVQDIETPLRLALSKLGHPLDDTEAPDLELQTQALQYLHVSAEQFARIRRTVVSGDDEWISIRLIPVICALNGISSRDKANKIREEFLELSASVGVKEALQQLAANGTGVTNPIELYILAGEANGDEDMANKLWSTHQVSLAVWNDAMRALGYPYRICRNNDIEEESLVILQELRPAVIAILRKALKENGEKEKYVSLKVSYDEMPPHVDWKEQYWQLPFAVVLETVLDWLKSQVSNMPSKLFEAMSESVNNV
ncbi:hypothetical protein ACFLV0_05710, partial [Chloroflexota bacterium]